MKKYFIISLMVLVFPVIALAYFQPVTMTNGATRLAVYSEEKAKALFGRGFVVETEKAIGAITSSNVMWDMTFNRTIRYKEKTQSQNGTTTLTGVQSGTTFYLTGSSSLITLPAATTSAGVTYRFVVAGALEAGNVILSPVQTDVIEGTLIVAGAVVDCDAADVITFVTDGENLGDFVELRSDGTKWFIGSSGVLTTAKMTCTG